MSKRIAVFGGSFNPPEVHHRAVVEALSAQFDRVIVVPCGPRPDKPPTNDIEPVHRAVMCDMAFRGIPNVEVALFDLENGTFTRTIALDERYRSLGEVWHVIGSDLVCGGATGAADIQTKWQNGADIWRELRFAVVDRPEFPFGAADLPPHSVMISVGRTGSSRGIRKMVYDHQPITGLVSSEIESYIDRYGLYRTSFRPNGARISFPDPKPFLIHDTRNPRAAALADRFSGIAVAKDHANCILAIGGDGTMLRAIREDDHWRLRLPFIGVNAGHRGYLLNNIDETELADPLFLFSNLLVYQLPQLRIEYTDISGAEYGLYAFNDAWVQRHGGNQSAWLRVTVDGRVRIKKLVGDGLLVCTPAGSTAYARAMRASPLLIDSRAWLLVGNNVFDPLGWVSAPLSVESEIRIDSLDYAKRPIAACIDGVDCGEVSSVRARVSKIASIELAFLARHDITAKLADDVFPE